MAKKYQLKNGLNVLLLENHKSPVVSVQMWVKTGSADETKGVEGISHFIEHLVFKGTKKYNVGEIASTVEAAGGELNAYTSFDQTVFYVTISKQFSDTALDVISEMMGRPRFDVDEIDKEREVVLEEIKRGEDSPSRRLSQALFSEMFKKHPYGIPVIGYDKVIKKVSAKKIKEYFDSRYVPSNMFLVVAGDFQSAEMKTKVRQYFGDFKPNKLKKVKRPKEPQQRTVRLKVEKVPFQQTSFYISWRTPSIKHKDNPALDVLSMILGSGDSSRLVDSLRIKDLVVNSVGSFSYSMQDDGLFAVSASVEEANIEKAFGGIQNELIRILNEAPSKEELQKIVTNLASHEIYSMETVDNIARKAGSNEFYMGDHDHFKKYLKQIYSLKPEDISKVARKYLLSGNFTVTFMSPFDQKQMRKRVQKCANDLKKALAIKKPVLKPVKYQVQKINLKHAGQKGQGKIKVVKTPEGMTLIFKHQPETPTVSARIAFLGGLRAENAGSEGTTELFSRNWISGSANFSEEELARLTESMAAGLSGFGGRNSVGLSMDYLSKDEKKIFQLFEDVLLNPTFPSEQVEREKLILLNQIKKRNDSPAQICMLNLNKALFRNHPYSRDMMGSEESLAKITSQSLHDYYQNIRSAANATICVVGDFDEKYWFERAKLISKKMGRGTRLDKKLEFAPLSKSETVYHALDKEQSHVVVGYPGLKIDDSRKYILEIIQSILSGQGGRLFIELRDKNSLAYSVAPLNMYGIECGYFGGYIACSPEKVEKAISMMKAEFEKLKKEVVSAEELSRAQRYLIGRHDIELQRKSAVCNSMLFDEIYGIDPTTSLDVYDAYMNVGVEDIQRVAGELFSQETVISIVGPAKRGAPVSE